VPGLVQVSSLFVDYPLTVLGSGTLVSKGPVRSPQHRRPLEPTQLCSLSTPLAYPSQYKQSHTIAPIKHKLLLNKASPINSKQVPTMGPFKLLALSIAGTATASTFYGAPLAISNTSDHISVTTIFSTTAVQASVSEHSQPPIITDTSCLGVSSSASTMSLVLSTMAPVVSEPAVSFSGPIDSTYINLSSFEAPAGNKTVTSNDVMVSTTSAAALPSVFSTTVVTETTNSTHYHTGTPTTSATTSPGPQSSGGKVKVGVAIGLAALLVGVLGA
jgi:hypothetical protein